MLPSSFIMRSLRKQRRQRESRLTKGLMSTTIAVHVRYKSVCISLPASSAKQQREMTNSALSEERDLRRLIIFFKILFQIYCGVLDSVSR